MFLKPLPLPHRPFVHDFRLRLQRGFGGQKISRLFPLQTRDKLRPIRWQLWRYEFARQQRRRFLGYFVPALFYWRPDCTAYPLCVPDDPDDGEFFCETLERP